MEQRYLGGLWPVSALTLGGGGTGQVWGETTREEAIATTRAAADAGITLFDMAPSYGRGEAEEVMGLAFDGPPPNSARVTTKCQLGSRPADEVYPKLERSLHESLARMKLEHVDLFFLHSNICPDDYTYARHAEHQDRFATRWSLYLEQVVPAMEKLVASGLASAWGITATGVPQTVMDAMAQDLKPAVAQCVANPMDAVGNMQSYAEPGQPRNVIRHAKANGLGVMGIRAVAAGSLTKAIDRDLPDDEATVVDYHKAARYRALCSELGEDPAIMAYRYALAMDGVDTVVLGVKNRAELAQCVEAADRGPLEHELVERIDALGLTA
ncbi:MAG: aldo/keto reductase [Alphaproteobacteria bacterium]